MGTDIQARQISRSIYIHIPFCLTKCDYCSFFSLPFNSFVLDEYTRYLHKEIELYKAYLPQNENETLVSIYFGGGSPDLLNPDAISSICSSLGIIEKTPETEISLEINPIRITHDFLSKLSQTPINRISLGVQSMLQSELDFLGRKHKAIDIPQKIALCREYGFENISVDLMYGLPGASIELLEQNLRSYMELKASHISAYLLTLDIDSPMAKRGIPLPDDDTAAELYEYLQKYLKENAYEQYEISNFCLQGFQSRHNMAYWKSENYLALGASACGYLKDFRYQNPSDLKQYYRSIDSGKLFPNKEILSHPQQKKDYLMMGLRCANGIDRAEYRRRFDEDVLMINPDKINELQKLGFIDYDEKRLFIKPTAFFISNALIGELI